MLEEDRGTVKHSVAYGTMEPSRKRWVWVVVSIALACLGAGAGVGVLFERTFHRDGHAAAAVTTSINTSTTPTVTAPSTSAVPSTTSSATRSVFYLVGDSHTQFGSDVNGWATRLQSLYVRSVDVLNRGLADFNTQQFVEAGLPIVTKELASSSFTPMVITLWFGLDDAALSDGPAARHQVHVDKYYDNLVHILRTFRKQSPRSKILVVSPLVVDNDTRRQVLVQRDESSGPSDRTNNMTKAYAAAAAEAASVLRDAAISHLDLYSYLMETYPNTTARAALFRDGLHLNEEGHRVVFEQVRTRIELIVPASMLQTAQIPLPETARVGH